MSEEKYEGPSTPALEAAGLVAPLVRSVKWEARQRRMFVTNKAGEVVGETKFEEVLKGLSKIEELELDVGEGVRPKKLKCPKCAVVFAVPPKGKIPTQCEECSLPPFCAREGCGKRVARKAIHKDAVNKRAGRPPSCSLQCSKMAMTPEQRSERGRRVNAARTPEQRSEAARKANAARTPEQRSEAARRVSRVNAARTPEQRSEIARKANAARTPEQRSEIARKRWETKRANAAAKKEML